MLPRPSICGVQAALATSTATPITRTAAPTLLSRFSTTSTTAHPVPIPPESPNFIKLPEPPQSSEVRLPPVRGHLPVPRQVFTKREGPNPAKAQIGWVPRIKPRSAAEQAGLPPANSHEARHRLLADSRRKSLAEGLQGLWQRQRTLDQRESRKSAARARANIAAAMQPERADEVLTRSSVRASTAFNTQVAPDPLRFDKAQEAAVRHAAKLALKSEDRRDALSQLYMAAGSFIVDEPDLEKVVNQVFSEHGMAHGGTDAAENIWTAQNKPISVTHQIGQKWKTIDDQFQRMDATKTTLRQKAVSEALTGGKLYTESAT